MDKRKQFQINNLTAKLQTFQLTLDNLIKQKLELLSGINNFRHFQNSIKVIENLKQEKQNKQQQITTLKTTISNIKHEITALQHQINNLPTNLQNSITNEINIYHEEITTLENLINEENINLAQKIIDEEQNKSLLLEQINNIMSDINNQNQIIQDLQIEAHQTRKNTLEELHQKKRDKISLQQQLTALNNNKNIYTDTVANLRDNNFILETLKKKLIDNYYSNTDIQSNIEYKNCIREINNIIHSNISPDSNCEEIQNPNNIIEKIDGIIQENNARIEIICRKGEKANVKINTQINNLLATIPEPHRTKTISNKVALKNEKNKRTELENIYKSLQELYTNYDEIIIAKLKDNHLGTISALEEHKQRAVERLNIMKTRITDENVSRQTELETRIQQLKNQIIETTQNIENISQEIINIENNIMNIDTTVSKLSELNDSILDVNNNIEKLQKDINALKG